MVYSIGLTAELIGMTKVTKATLVVVGTAMPSHEIAPSSPIGHQHIKSVTAIVMSRRAIVMFCCRLDIVSSIELHLKDM